MKLRKCATGFFRTAALGLAGYCFATVSPSWAATTTVDIIDYAFSPTNVTINVNDTIHWVWQRDLHSSTAGVTFGSDPDDGLWDSGVYNTGHTFDYTFLASGSYPYYCSYHFFTGSVNVQAPLSGPPSVAITNPAGGAIFSAPSTFAVAATASETNGTIANVEFFNGLTSLGRLPAKPYAVTVQNLGVGDYTFSAVATDGSSKKATNSIVVHVVASAPVNISVPQYSLSGTFQFNYSATAGLSYVVDRATALGSWTPIITNTSSGSLTSFLDTNALGSAQYYRVRQMPNP